MVDVKFNIKNFDYDFGDLKTIFPEAPQKGDFISLFQFLPYNTEVRDNFFSIIREKELNFDGEIIGKTWCFNKPNEKAHLLISVQLTEI